MRVVYTFDPTLELESVCGVEPFVHLSIRVTGGECLQSIA